LKSENVNEFQLAGEHFSRPKEMNSWIPTIIIFFHGMAPI